MASRVDLGGEPMADSMRGGVDAEVEALAYCEECPVRQECLASAFELGERWTTGIWGGTTGRDRHGLRRGVA